MDLSSCHNYSFFRVSWYYYTTRQLGRQYYFLDLPGAGLPVVLAFFLKDSGISLNLLGLVFVSYWERLPGVRLFPERSRVIAQVNRLKAIRIASIVIAIVIPIALLYHIADCLSSYCRRDADCVYSQWIADC